MYLWHCILRVNFHGKVYVNIFQKVVPSLTSFNFMTQIRHWLRWLRCFTRLHIKMHSLVTSLTLRRYKKNSLIADCIGYADIQGNTKNKFITEFADYFSIPDENWDWEVIMLIFTIKHKIVSSLTTLTTLILEST